MLTPVVLAGMWGLGKRMAVAAGAGGGAGYSRVEDLAVDVLRLRRRAPRSQGHQEKNPPLSRWGKGAQKREQREMTMSVVRSITKVPTLFLWVSFISIVAYGKSQT